MLSMALMPLVHVVPSGAQTVQAKDVSGVAAVASAADT